MVSILGNWRKIQMDSENVWVPQSLVVLVWPYKAEMVLLFNKLKFWGAQNSGFGLGSPFFLNIWSCPKG